MKIVSKTSLSMLALVFIAGILPGKYSFADSPVTIVFDGHNMLTFNSNGFGANCENQYLLFIAPNPPTGQVVWGKKTSLPFTLNLTSIPLSAGASYTAQMECADTDPSDKITFTYSPIAPSPTLVLTPTVTPSHTTTLTPTNVPNQAPTTRTTSSASSTPKNFSDIVAGFFNALISWIKSHL